MKIPFFNLERQNNEIREELEKEALRVLHSTQYIEGDDVRRLEDSLREYLKVKHVITCNSGTDALRIALQSADVKKGDEVITTAFSFFATAEAIAQLEAIPVFVDINPDSLNIDPCMIKEKVSNRTKAILPVHIFGLPADMNDITGIAKVFRLPVIEDACQAIGSVYHGKKTGTLGDIGCFSFYPTKNLGGFGDGGMITTDNDDLAIIASAIKSHGAGRNASRALEIMSSETVSKPYVGDCADGYDPFKYHNYLIGCNSRLDSIQAALLCVKMKHLDEYNKRRMEIAGQYSNAFGSMPVKIQFSNDADVFSCMHQYVILVENKEDFIRFMKSKGIGTGEFYPTPLHLQPAFEKLGYREGDLPISEKVCSGTVCLPIFPELTDEEVNYIIENVKDYFR